METDIKIGDEVTHKYLGWLVGTPFAGGYARRFDGTKLVISQAKGRSGPNNLTIRVNPKFWRKV